MEKKMENGRSMIEMLGVLAVIGVLTVSGFALVGKMHSSRQVSRVMDDISEMALKTRAFLREYDSDNACTHPTCSIVQKMNADNMIPDSLVYEDKKLVNVDDVRFYVDFTNHSGTQEKVLFKLYVENVTEEMCLKIATANWGGASTGYNNTIKIGDNSVIEGDVSISVATQQCADDLTITMDYR